MKKATSMFLAIALVFSLISIFIPHTNAETITAQGADFVHRSDGIWYFPLPSRYYNTFSDWAGCPGYGTCPFHNVKEPQYGDNYHTGQAYGHNGFDVATGGNKCDVYAAASGTAYCSYSSSARGYYVVVEHSLGNGYSYYSYYQHLSAISVENGTTVTVGQTIGKVGNTGGDYGIHLHFGIVLGTSGRGINAPNSLERNGWVLTAGFQEGRICNNPALNSPAGFPTGNINSLKPHAGSVMYTFNKSEVAIGESNIIEPATTLEFRDVVYPRQFRIDTTNGWYLQGGTLVSNVELSSIRSEIRLRDGTLMNEYGPITISGKSYSINNRDFDRNVRFDWITTPGDYDWILIATDSAGNTLSIDMPITAVNSGSTQTATMSKTWPDLTIGAEMLTGYGRPIADGVYMIVNAGDQRYYLDIEGVEVPAVNGTNVSICGPRSSSDLPLYDLWTVTYIDNGFYSIKQYNSNASLDVANADKRQGVNILVYESHGDSNQQWAISSHPYGGYRIQARVSSFSVNVYNSIISNGNNICQYSNNDTSAQAWVFIPYDEIQSISLNKSSTVLTIGAMETLLATIYPSNAINKNMTWASNNNSVATVTNGVVTAKAVGVATITVTTDNGGKTATCKVIVRDTAPMTLPAKLTTIGEEAFTGIAAREIIVPNGVKSIGSKAFANCANLKLIMISDSVTEIAYNAFTDSPNVCIIAEHANAATEFANAIGIQWVTLDGN